MTPSGIFDTLETVLQCVCSAMDEMALDVENYPGCPCLQYVSAGEPAVDCCSDESCEGNHGMLTTHVESVYPSEVFPTPAEGFEPCKAATWVAVVVVTAARCAPQTDDEGNMLPPETFTAAAEVMAYDQYAILTALGCCVVGDPPPGKRTRRVLIGETRPLVSEGGCASVEVRAFVELGRVCACPGGS